ADKSGNVWWGNNQGLHGWSQRGRKDFGIEDGLTGSVVKWIQEGRGGDLIVITGERSEVPGRRGLCCLHRGEFRRIELAAFQVEDDVICALADLEGNIWVGTRTDGLIRLQPRRLACFQDGLPHVTALSICEAVNGAIFVGTSRGLGVIK